MKKLQLIGLVIVMATAVACQTLYTGVTTLTDVVESASKEYARLYNDGLVPADVAARAAAAHTSYQVAAGLAHDALVATKAGQTADVPAAIEAARTAAKAFINVLVPLLSKSKAASLQSSVAKASNL